MSQNPLKAAVWMMGSVTAFTAMAVAARQIQGTHDTFEIMAARSVVGLVLVSGFALATGRRAQITRQRLSGHLLRNIVHFTGQNLWLFALALIPLAQVFAIEFTSPLWVLLLAPLALGEALTRPRLVAAALGFAGILIVTRPWGLGIGWGVAAAAGSALCFATTSLLTKRLTRDEPVLAILFWLTLMQAVFGIVLAGADGSVHWPDAATAPWLVVIGMAGVGAHLSLTSALRLAPAAFVMPIDFLRLPLIAVVGAALYEEPLDPYVLLGGAVIFAGVVHNLRAELGRNRNTRGADLS